MKLDKRIGVCHICGQRDRLTYEHVPPKAALNNQSAKLFSGEVILNSAKNTNTLPWETQGLRYIKFQQGKGFYSLCTSCNNLTGHWYGPAYTDFTWGIHLMLQKCDLDNVSGIHLTARSMNPLAVFKQIISMFCSINPETVGADFRDFLLNRDSNQFNKSKFKVCAYIHRGVLERYCPITGILKLPHNVSAVSEISIYPMGFILYFLTGKEGKFDGIDITDFADCDYNQPYSLDMSIPLYECNILFPTDFRQKAEIIKCQEENQKGVQ